MKPRILIVDDDSLIRDTMQFSLQSSFELIEASSVAMGRRLIQQLSFDAVLVDLNFEKQPENGIHLIDWMTKKYPSLPIIVFSGDHCTSRVSESMRRNIFQFIPKDADVTHIKFELNRAVAHHEQATNSNKQTFCTSSRKMKDLLAEAERVTTFGTDSAILVVGETGTGKEIFARHLAEISKKAFITANMSALSENIAASELFGHKRGAFTGATEDSPGLILSANGGIFFLDELGECSLNIQAMLLRVIQEKELVPVGATKPEKVNVQFIGATNRNLTRMVKQNQFREDLLQRLSVFSFYLPPLRERTEDILYYANLFVSQLSARKTGLAYSFSPEAYDLLLEYQWPGNIRELKNVIERACVLSQSKLITADKIREYLYSYNERLNAFPQPIQEVQEDLQATPRPRRIVSMEQIQQSIADTAGNKKLAAHRLGISRAQLYRLMSKDLDEPLPSNTLQRGGGPNA